MATKTKPTDADRAARLAAAAPEMYQTLLQIVDDWPTLTDGDDEQWDISGADMIEYVAGIAAWVASELQPAVEGA